MGISSRQLGLLVSEIKADLSGGRIRNIDQPDATTLLFEIAQGKQRYRLLFSAHRNFARIHLIHQKHPRPPIPPGFCQLLRAHLRHKYIQKIQQHPNDRIIEMYCSWSKEAPQAIRFLAELTGLCANFFLLNPKGQILGMLRPAPSSRELHQGAVYSPPPRQITSGFQETQVPTVQADTFPINQAFERYFSELEKQVCEAQQKKASLARFDTAIRQFEKRLRRFEARLHASKKSLQYRNYGEYLKCHLHEIPPAAKSFEYVNPLASDQEKSEVKLDPSLSAAQNMAHFFKRYKKAVEEKSIHLTLLAKTQIDLKKLKIGKKTLLEGNPLNLNDFPLSSPQKKPRTNKTKKGAQTYLSSDKLRLMVGRNSLENDILTFRVARGNDLWFHARGTSGAHLVVKMEKRKDLPPQTLLEAATLALYFSPYRKEGKGEVMYTYKKYLRRPSGGKAGAVICSQEKTLFIEIDPARLSKILGNRLDYAQE